MGEPEALAQDPAKRKDVFLCNDLITVNNQVVSKCEKMEDFWAFVYGTERIHIRNFARFKRTCPCKVQLGSQKPIFDEELRRWIEVAKKTTEDIAKYCQRNAARAQSSAEAVGQVNH